MLEVLVFAGTSEGRELCSWLVARGTAEVWVSCATDYGASLMLEGPRLHVLTGARDGLELQKLIESHDFCCIVDATHPFAERITESLREFSAASGLAYVRIEREQSPLEGATLVEDAAEAAMLIQETTGNVLLTTGTKDLATFAGALPDAAERLYVRLLPTVESIMRAQDVGIPHAHLIALQGPFSVALNRALIDEFAIKHLVTKESGPRGGFDQKRQAAEEADIDLIVIRRPMSVDGISLEDAERLLEVRYGL